MPRCGDGTVVFEPAVMPGARLAQGRRPRVIVPGEQVLCVVVDLPLSSHRQRLEAVGFAVEGLIAEPLSKVHVALGPQVAPKRYLAAMVSHETMAGWTDSVRRAGLSQALLLPDCLVLPRLIDDGWTIFASNGRAVVRRSDLSGFSIRLSMLEAAWKLAGCPAVVSCGEPLPPSLLASPPGAAPEQPDILATGFTLAQGAYAVSSFKASPVLRRAGWICGVGLAVLGAISVADTIALDGIAKERRNAAQALISKVAPDSNPAESIDAQLARILPDRVGDGPGRFLPLFSDVAAALQTESEGLVVESLAYDAADGELGLDVAATNLAALQRIEATLKNAGLRASSGVATADGGAAKARIVVTDAEGRAGS